MSNFLKDATPAPAAGVAKPNTGPASPVQHPGLKQLDENQSSLGARPTRASLQDRPSTTSSGRTGMETALGALADQLHPPKFRGRR